MSARDLPYILLSVLILGYLLFYLRKAPTHPLVYFFLLFFLYLPAKYFFVELGGLDYAFYADQISDLKKSSAVEIAGYCLLAYLLLSLVVQLTLAQVKLRVPILSARVSYPMGLVSVSLAALQLMLFLALGSGASLANGLEFRAFTQTKGMGVISIIYDLTVLIALLQALDQRRTARLGLLLLVHGVFALLGGRSAPLVNMVVFIGMYLFVVRRYVPVLALAGAAIVVPVLALVHGIVRVRGDLLSSASYLGEVLTENPDLYKFIGSQIIGRVNYIEEFSMLSSQIVNGDLATNIGWPANAFVQFIPRGIWPDKPFFFNSEMMSIFYPQILDAGVTFNFLALAEFLYVFGLAGIVPAALVTGLLLHVVHRYSQNSMHDSGAFLFFFLVPYTCLYYGFYVGWMNTPVLATVLINLLVLMMTGSLKVVPSPGRGA
jgi:hypothetical protein